MAPPLADLPGGSQLVLARQLGKKVKQLANWKARNRGSPRWRRPCAVARASAMSDLDEADAHFQRGMEAVRAENYEAAILAFRRSVQACPSHGPTHGNLGSALAAQERHREAVAAFQAALGCDPPFVPAHFLMGLSLLAIGNEQQAAQCFADAIAGEPDNVGAYYFLAMIRLRAGDSEQAFALLQHAIRLEPRNADLFTGLGAVFRQRREAALSRHAFEAALTIDPDHDVARANYLFRLAQDCEWEAIDSQRNRIASLGIAGTPVPPFLFLAFEDEPKRHRMRAERFVGDFAKVAPLAARPVPNHRPGRLRIGYFSADFRDHATMHLAARMFELHDRGRFESIAYSFGRDDGSAMRKRAERGFDLFRDVRGLSSFDIARQAHEDGIDIAVDLKGLTENHRLEIFAYRPAPIQISYLGYPGTSGAPFIDYMIADRWTVPDDERSAYCECLIRLPESYQVNDARGSAPRLRVYRHEHGLPEDAFVFACFNNSYKIGRRDFALWMDLLAAVAASVLWLIDFGETAKSNLAAAASRHGIDPRRLVFAPRIERSEHLSRHVLADLFLDTLPCNAHTTASDALRMGVPIVTRAGRGFAARVAASLLSAVGLESMIAAGDEDYVRIARELAGDPGRLAALRGHLSEEPVLPLFDTARTVQAIEAGFDAAYDRYLRGEAPTDIRVGG
jgi:protein O-GlcNAc transferase